MTNAPRETLYTDVTADIARRITEHREGLADGFTKRYGLKRLVYAERYEEIEQAIAREKQLKNWKRAWKIDLIVSANPDWDDLYDTLLS
ncbi:putative endonuclease [Parvibaculum indicum]|nr:putative endonuclease [Parvibaculum indicum]